MTRSLWPAALTAIAFGLTGALVQAADKAAIARAAEKGVAFLKSAQAGDGSYPYGGAEDVRTVGSTALVALALLECDVPASDEVVKKAAAFVRARCPGLQYTYSIALAILLFDRLGEPADVPLIEALGVRLMAGQTSAGTWTYNCPAAPESEVRRLTAVIKGRNERVRGREAPGLERKDGWMRRDPRDLPREIQDQVAEVLRGAGGAVPLTGGDNSNTQFANLGLWAAGRYGVPVERALARIEAHYRRTQNPDGGWGYVPGPAAAPNPLMRVGLPGGNSSPAMTCAGLLGLATAHGAANDLAARQGKPKLATDPGKDVHVKTGLFALGTALDNPEAKQGPERLPLIAADRAGRGYYFLWSLERVGVAFGLDTIGNKDWYNYGADIILRNQAPYGGWTAGHTGPVDSAFALLFLKRANLTRDLTATLKGRVTDPGQRELRAGVGGDDLAKKLGLKPAFAPEEKKIDDEVSRLSARLLEAPAERQEQVVQELRDARGAIYTEALAAAIPRLEGKIKSKAREALAERLTRMTSATLKDKLHDEDPEVRRAAALAVAMKEDRAHIPRLIELLDDPETLVVRAAYAALKSLSGQDFGPAADATRAEKAKAVADWKAWWARQRDR